MTIAQTEEPTRQIQLRLWPGVVVAVLLLLIRYGANIVVPGFEGFQIAIMGGLLCALLIVVWWAFLSRAPRIERWGGVALMIVALAVTWRLDHESMRLMPFFAHTIPVVCLALAAWAVASRRLADGPRRATMVATILLACGVWTLFRIDGVTGDHVAEFAWRWAETSEERLLAHVGDEPTALSSTPAATEKGAGWPGLRGGDRDGIIRGIRIETDWSASPPVELWRRPIGPGWSSFAVRGELLYTQEQRGDHELVSCYNAANGEPVWQHHDEARFWEANGGAGPRATPTLSGDRLYTLGATGIVNALDAEDGAVVWSRNATSDTETKVPIWGFSGSPLVVDDVVIVAAAGSLAAYEVATGELRWSDPDGGDCYSSPHLVTIDGVTQVLLLNQEGAASFVPADGSLLWEHPWPGYPIVQPAPIGNGDLLLSASQSLGMRRIAVRNNTDGWAVEERWTSTRLKPYFNDFVVHDGNVYGFDGRVLACIDLNDGQRVWKGGRYGNGQLVLVADQNLLLVLSEKGELALVKATPDQFRELARFQAIEGKTWNHPVLVNDVVLVRNSEEMAAFRLTLAEG